MTALSPRDVFAVRNETEEPARLWLMCSGYRVWDVWIAPRGGVSAPAFPPERMTLEGTLVEQRTQVAYCATTAPSPSSGTVVAALDRQSGANLLTLREDESAVPNTLRISNTCGGALDFVVRYCNSPYAAAGFVDADGRVDLKYDALAIVVTINGISVPRELNGSQSRWSVRRHVGEAGVVLTLAEVNRDDAGRY